ncbi:MAG TPA: S8 family serine peptidase [Steroidobacteraceae bacterium]|nr:S8 family serine peptidase [Steroidobacteraceae bacterium]
MLIVLLAASLCEGASAQLPRVQVPALPGVVPALPEATRAVGGTVRELTGARALRVNRLFVENRAQLDRDPRGELVVRAEVVAIDITQPALDQAVAEKFSVRRVEELADLGVKITILQTPEGMSAARGLKRLRKLDPEGTYDFNHVYLDSGEIGAGRLRSVADDPAGDTTPAAAGRAGLIDGGVDSAHQVLKKTRVQRFGCAGAVVPSAHGTAVASILLSRGTISELFAADVYCGEPAGGAVDAVAAAFSWMAREKVAVINVSLVGPRNALLERVVGALVARGHVIVAAVGNDGPASPPLYPAAYEGVIGVTGVDAKHRVLIEACRGKQVDFAALGAEVSAAAGAPDQFAAVRGTSFAAPLVAAMLAELRAPDAGLRTEMLGRLSAAAEDLGKPGRDDIYGAGELGSAYK